MAVEDIEDLSLFFDPDDFGTAASYADGGAPISVTGILHRKTEIADAPGFGGVAHRVTEFVCAESVLFAARDGGVLTIGGDVYTVRSSQPDGTGLVRLVLEASS